MPNEPDTDHDDLSENGQRLFEQIVRTVLDADDEESPTATADPSQPRYVHGSDFV